MLLFFKNFFSQLPDYCLKSPQLTIHLCLDKYNGHLSCSLLGTKLVFTLQKLLPIWFASNIYKQSFKDSACIQKLSSTFLFTRSQLAIPRVVANTTSGCLDHSWQGFWFMYMGNRMHTSAIFQTLFVYT